MGKRLHFNHDARQRLQRSAAQLAEQVLPGADVDVAGAALEHAHRVLRRAPRRTGARGAGARRTSRRVPLVGRGLRLGRADGGDLLGDVDADRAPGDAAAAADAARRAELVEPGRRACASSTADSASASIGADAAAVDVGEIEREARIPAPDAFGLVAGEVGHVLDRRAEAGRTDHRAVAAATGSARRRRPSADARGCAQSRSRMSSCPSAGPCAPRRARTTPRPREVGRRRRRAQEAGEHLGAALAAGLDEEAVLPVEQLGQREVVARRRPRPGAHRDAEARPPARRS